MARRTGWVGYGSGFLVSVTDSGSRFSFIDSFSDLAQLDVYGDGVINASDPAFSTLHIWQDTNGNGKVDPGEIQSLSSLGIQSLNLTYVAANHDTNGNMVTGIGSVTMTDGTTRELAAVNLQTSVTYTQADQTPVISVAIAALPELHGYGRMMDLQSQMASDPVLVGLVQSFVQLAAGPVTMADLRAATDAIMFQWAGVASVDPTSRGDRLDARRLEFLEHYLGQPMTFVNGNYGGINNPGLLPALLANNGFIDLENGILARLLVQTSPTLAAEFTYAPTADTIQPKVGLFTSLADLSTKLGPITSQNLDAWSAVSVVLNAFQADYNIDTTTFAEALSVSGIQGLDILENALAQGLAVSIDSTGTMDVSNSPTDGIDIANAFEIGERTRPAGLNFVYNPGDGPVDLSFAEATSLFQNQAGVVNTLMIGAAAADITASMAANGDQIFTDDISGDILTIAGEAIIGTGWTYGTPSFQFDDGTVWTGAHIVASAGQRDLTSTVSGIIYDTRGFAATIEASGNNGVFLFNPGYGNLRVTATGWNNTIRLGTGIAPSAVTLALDAATGNLSLVIGSSGDVLTLVGEYTNGSSQGHASSIVFADGTTWTLGAGQTAPFTWTGTPTHTTLTGSPLSQVNIFNLAPGGDTVFASSGYSQFNYDLGDGAATINYGGSGAISLGAHITAANAYLQSDANNDLIIRFVGDDTDSITATGDLYWNRWGASSMIAHILYANGTSQLLGFASDWSAYTPLVFDWYADATTKNLVGNGLASKNIFHLAPGGGTVTAASGYSQVDYDLGDGAVTVNPYNPAYGGTGAVSLGADISAANVYLQSDANNDLIIRFIGDASDKITVIGDLYWNRWAASSDMSHILYANGTSQLIGFTSDWSAYTPVVFNWYADANTTNLVGNGLASTNIFHLAPGGDVVTTTSGYSQVDYDRGDGAVTINPYNPANGGSGSISLGAGITAANSYLQSDANNDLIIRFIGDATDSITVIGDLYWNRWAASSEMSNILYANGTSQLIGFTSDWSAYTPITFNWYADATTTNLVGNGLAPTNIFHMFPGGDTVTAASGYSQVDYELGDGAVTVNPYSPANGGSGAISLGSNISAANTYLQSDANNDLIIRFIGDATDKITVTGDMYWNRFGSSSMMSKILYANGTSQLLGFASDWSAYAPIVFNWFADATTTNLVGNWLAPTNIFHLAPGGDTVTAASGYSQVDYDLGDGAVTVNPYSHASGGSGAILLGADITAADVYFQSNANNDLIIRFVGDATDSITLINDLYWNRFGFSSEMSNILYANGTSLLLGIANDWTANTPLVFDWYADANTTVLTGSRVGENVYHPSTANISIAPSTNTVTWINSVSWNNTNQFELDVGNGTTSVNMAGALGIVLGGPSITASDVTISFGNVVFSDTETQAQFLQSMLGATLDISIAGNTGYIFSNDFTLPYGALSSAIDIVTFQDGSYINIGGQVTYTMVGTATNTVLHGSETGNNVFILGAGGDSVYATNGTVLGITGFMSEGGQNTNTFIYGRGDGHATIDMGAGIGNLNLTQGLMASEVSFALSGSDLVMSIAGDFADSITFRNSAGGWTTTARTIATSGNGSPGGIANPGGNVIPGGSLQSIHFADGSSYNIHQWLPAASG